MSQGPSSGPNPFRGTMLQCLGCLMRPRWYGTRANADTATRVLCQLPRLFHFFVINLAGLIIAVSSVETMIRENHISTVGVLESTGQMMALTAGISSLCLASWEIVSKWRQPRLSGIQMLARMRYSSAQPIGEEELMMFQEYLVQRRAEWITNCEH